MNQFKQAVPFFRKMSFHLFLIGIVILPHCVAKTIECTQKNASCDDIKTPRGYRFPYDCVAVIEVNVYSNQTLIANAKTGKQDNLLLNVVLSMDNCSIITRECSDLRIQCIVPNGNYVKETCEEFKISERMNPDVRDLTTPWGLIIGVLFGAMLVIGIVMFCGCWKKKQEPNQGREAQDITAGDCKNPHSDFSLVEIPSVTDPHASGENDLRGNTFGAAHVHSIDPKADDKTQQTPGLVCNIGNEKMQPTKKISKDDPGGVNTVRTLNMNNGHTQGDRGPEGQPLLLDQRTAVQCSDMTGEAAALANKSSFNPDQISSSSTALDTDVESTLRMKHCSINKY
ncbi:uncharacterized protein LOC113158921 [Anabas testudineus]|uniref:uncharacterized protein LOC113158921 n=1 Tax=Anabas testudineus TaxID=64144 RepID=UPI000E457CD7|nr:uncharacterized protein LOC113158921 [Anabas testudineus]